ncbi:ferulic acid esterase [Colletotrichum kahawae]|uniref:feruloyl esterase n=1 Tax=Colletotrichum kahawae TaxID=34407 RepID=A0AAD9YA06_COLKA|nr:ferulic acid esterase [Colletotrichum kahawae]
MVNFNFVTLLADLCASAAIQDAVKREVSSDGCKKALPSHRSAGHEYLIPYKDDQSHDRDYLLFIPPKYSKTSPNPIIFSYHGGTKTPEEQRDLDLLETSYFNKDHIVVYLRGYEVRTRTTSRTTMIDQTRDDGRACLILHRGMTSSTPTRTNIPMVEFHGGIDGTIPYNGSDSRRGACLPDIYHWVTEWAVRDGLGEKATVCNITSRAQRYQWGSGDKKGLVSHVFEKDVDHSWLYTGVNDDNKAHGDGPASYNASSYIMEFFSKHILN